MTFTPLKGHVKDLKARGISREAAAKYAYKIGKRENGEPVHLAHFYRDGQLIAQKYRTKDKKFGWLGDAKRSGFFGQHLFKPGKRLVITEGEIDAMTVSQALNMRWPSVSLPHGAANAMNTFKQELEYLEQWEQVIICFDNDEPGMKAAHECAKLLSPGKASIATLAMKDANEMWLAGQSAQLVDALWQAKPVEPSGLVNLADCFDVMMQKPEKGLETPYAGLNELTGGLRPGTITILCAGTSVGKTTVVKQVVRHMIVEHQVGVGCIFLEESLQTTLLSLVGLELGVPLHIHGHDAPEEDKRKAFEKLCGSDLLHSVDKFGSATYETVARSIRYWVKRFGVKVVVLDHIAALTSGDATSGYKQIDEIMTKLSEVVRELDIALVAISHLNRSKSQDGAIAEEGGRVTLASLRGSHSIGQWADTVLSLERNLQADTEDERAVSTVRVLKNRYLGQTGVACKLKFDFKTGRMNELAPDFKPVTKDEDEFAGPAEPVFKPADEDNNETPLGAETPLETEEVEFDGF